VIACDEVALRLLDYALDDLEPQARDEVDAHLQACPPCGRLVEEYRAVSHMIHDALEVELSEEEQAALDDAVLQAVARSA